MPSSQLERRLTAVFAAEAVTIGDGDNIRMEAWLGTLSEYKTTLASQIKATGGEVIGRSHTLQFWPNLAPSCTQSIAV